MNSLKCISCGFVKPIEIGMVVKTTPLARECLITWCQVCQLDTIHLRMKNDIEQINHPAHYGGPDSQYEAIKVIEAWGLDKSFCLGNCLKYICRAGKKPGQDKLQDLYKAKWYLERQIEQEKNQLPRLTMPNKTS